MQEINSIRELDTVISIAPLVLIDIYADWCIPCKWMTSVLEKIQNELEYMGFKLVKVNADKINVDEMATLLKLGRPVTSLPTLIIIKDRVEIGRIVGASPRPNFADYLKEMIIDSLRKNRI